MKTLRPAFISLPFALAIILMVSFNLMAALLVGVVRTTCGTLFENSTPSIADVL